MSIAQKFTKLLLTKQYAARQMAAMKAGQFVARVINSHPS
jgi:hypothetical protein